VNWDPHSVGERPLFVWAPDDRSRTYPVVYVLHSHLRNAQSWFNVDPFEENYPAAIERVAPAAIVALVDGWTEHGGGQWLGPLGDYLRAEVVPFVEERYPANGLRALQGKSSGAYGALVHALARPDLFHAVAAHAPMALFEVTVAHDFAFAARELRERGLTSIDDAFPLDGLKSQGDAVLAEIASLAHAFSDGDLPFDLRTGALVPEVWERWLANDPLRLARGADLGSLRGVWLDAGRWDEYFLDLGALALHDELLANGLPEERLHFELFDGGHRGVSGRYPLSLDCLVRFLSMTF
jgi:hypothetical protein